MAAGPRALSFFFINIKKADGFAAKNAIRARALWGKEK
jgi:hypothetical protein